MLGEGVLLFGIGIFGSPGIPGGAIFALAVAPVGYFDCPVGSSGSAGGRGIFYLRKNRVLCFVAPAAPAYGAAVLEQIGASEYSQPCPRGVYCFPCGV